MRIAIVSEDETGAICARSLESNSHEIVGVGLHNDRRKVSDEVLDEKRWTLLASWEDCLRAEPDILLSTGFRSLLPDRVVERLWCVNIHFALLPRFRGRHGFLWALINGDREVGFTIHRIDSGVDTGSVYHQERTCFQESDTFTTVMQRLVDRLVAVLPEVLSAVFDGSLQARPQDKKGVIHVSRRYFIDNYIDWSWPSQIIHNMVRTLGPPYAPGAFTFYQKQMLFILESEMLDCPAYFEIPGHVVARYPGQGVWVKTGDGALLVKKVRWQEKTQTAWEVFRGVGARLGIDWLEVAAKVGVIDLC